MRNEIQTYSSYSHPEVEAHLNELENMVPEYKLLGKQDGQKDQLLQEIEFNLKIVDAVHIRVQDVINFIRQKLQPTAKLFNAEAIRTAAVKKIEILKKELNYLHQKLFKLESEKKAIPVNYFKRRMGKLLPYIAGILAAADTILSYGGFRNVYPVATAAIAAASVGICIYISHHFAGWVHAGKTILQKKLRCVTLLAASSILFLLIGNFRAQALQSVTTISVPEQGMSTTHAATISGWMIAGISEVLFATVLLLALLFWRNKKEQANEEAYNSKCAEVKECEKAAVQITTDIMVTEAHAAQVSSEARSAYDYTQNTIRRSKNIGDGAIQQYMAAYLHFHTGPVPAFFAQNSEHVYDESLRFSTPSNTETI